MHYDSTSACVMSKLESKDSPHLLLDWCGDVGVQDITYLNGLRHFYAKLVGPFEIAGSPFAN